MRLLIGGSAALEPPCFRNPILREVTQSLRRSPGAASLPLPAKLASFRTPPKVGFTEFLFHSFPESLSCPTPLPAANLLPSLLPM